MLHRLVQLRDKVSVKLWFNGDPTTLACDNILFYVGLNGLEIFIYHGLFCRKMYGDGTGHFQIILFSFGAFLNPYLTVEF